MDFEIQTVPLVDSRTTTTTKRNAEASPVAASGRNSDPNSTVDSLIAALIPESIAPASDSSDASDVFVEFEPDIHTDTQAEAHSGNATETDSISDAVDALTSNTEL